jgi:ankyrin repeat protein
VSLTNVETKEVFDSYSDGTGTYKFESLPAGTFNLKIKAQGFADGDVPMLTLRANDTNRIDQTLSIASVQAEVEVQAEGQLESNERRVIAIAGGAVVRMPTESLVRAAQLDDLETMRLALLEKHDANVRDKLTDDTALELAVRNGNREMIQLLLWAKADVNLKDRNGQTVLMMLGEDVTTEIVWDLLNAGARINQRDNDGETALMAAAQINNVEC